MRGEPHDQPIHAQFQRAVDDLHARCRAACARPVSCDDRFAAVIDVAVTWTRDHPDQARLYWREQASPTDAELSQMARNAQKQLACVITQDIFRDDATTLHEVIIEFTLGAFRQLMDDALQDAEPHLTHMPEQLTQLSPILKYLHRSQ